MNINTEDNLVEKTTAEYLEAELRWVIFLPIPFIVDTYILLRYVEVESAIRKAITVLKMRGSDHHKEIMQYHCTSQGLEMINSFAGREGIMSGISHNTPQDAFVDVFGKKRKK